MMRTFAVSKMLLTLVTTTALLLVATGIAQEDHDHQDAESTGNIAEGHTDAGHLEELVVELTPEAVALAGVRVSSVSRGRIGNSIELPGEISFNEDRLAHISPRFAGIAISARYRVGDHVDSGAVVAVIESNESMNAYSIKAPISGWIIERHVTPGEFVSGESSIYVIADLSLVWVNLAVYPGEAGKVKKGLEVHVKAVGSDVQTEGRIDYVTPILDVNTRSLTARVVLPNDGNKWRPGMFVQGTVVTESGDDGLIVAKDAVQYLDEKSIVFVFDGGHRFRPVEVAIGDYDEHNIRILDGLEEGTKYVAEGAFELKAKITTSAMDGHAGHGH